MQIKLSIVSKLTALVIAAVMLTAFAVNEVYMRGSVEILTEDAIHDLDTETGFLRYPLNSKLDEIRDDVRLLANLPTLQEIIRASLNDKRDPGSKSPQEGTEEWLA